MLRADSLATLHVFHPLSKRMSGTRARVPILMYHSVSDQEESGVHPYYQTVTKPSVFAQQMRYLFENGYSSIGLGDALAYVKANGNDALRKPVVLTFDDGYRDFYTDAFPILSRYAFEATMFLATSYIGTQAQALNGRTCLSWSQVRELRQSGIEFGAHTVTHPQLRNLRRDQIRDELLHAKERIEQELGSPVKSFSYPYAFPEPDRPFTESLRGMLTEFGYEHGVSTIVGTATSADDRFFMRRLPVNSGDNAPLFRAKLEGGYDWLHGFQYASKLLAAHLS